jgi:hypothetical protein
MAKDLHWEKIREKFSSEKLPDLSNKKTLASIQESVKESNRPRLELQDSLRAKSLARSFVKVVK